MWKEYKKNDEVDWDNWEYDENDNEGSVKSMGKDDDESIIIKDANWNILKDWDTVIAIKDIKVKWSRDIKRWDKFPKITLTDNVDLIESGKMVLRTEFFKKI